MKKYLLFLVAVIMLILVLAPAGTASADVGKPPSVCPPGYVVRPLLPAEDEMLCANLELHGVMGTDGSFCVKQAPPTVQAKQPRFEFMLP